MAKSSSTTLVSVPVERVWETLADFGGISRWGTGVEQSSLLSDVIDGVGATRRVQVGRNALRETVTVWLPGQQLAYTLVGLPPVVREATNAWELATEGAGTRVTLTSTVRTRGGPLLAHLVAGKIGKANKRLVTGLREHLEGANA